MVANMAGSGVQERVRVSAVRVRGKRRACAITGGLPCRRTRRSSMSEYRPGVTSPHTLPQRAHPLSPRSSFGLTPLRPPPTRPSLSYYLAAYLQRGASPHLSLSFSLSVYPLDLSLSRPPLLSTSSSPLIIPVLPVCVVLLILCLRFFLLTVHLSRTALPDSSLFAVPRKCPLPLPSPDIFSCFGNLVHAFLLGLNYA